MPSRRLIVLGVVAGLGLPLACLKRSPEADVPGLIADLKNPDPGVSGKANLALIRLGEPAVPQRTRAVAPRSQQGPSYGLEGLRGTCDTTLGRFARRSMSLKAARSRLKTSLS